MAQSSPTHVIDVESAISCPADKIYDLLKNHFTQLPVIFPEIYKSATVLAGDGKSLGSVRRWTYVIHHTSDEVLEAIEKLTEIDDEKRTLTYSIVGGDVLKTHKQFDVRVVVNPKGTGSVVKWHIIFVKADENNPHPDPYLEICDNIHKKFEQHFHKV